jgi:hypothetical protein
MATDTFDSDGVDPNQTLIDALSKPSAKDKSWGRGNYGTNASSQSPSLTPGTKAPPSSVAASNSDPLLDELATRNAPKMAPRAKLDAHPRGGDSWQTRDVGDGNVPAGFGMKGQQASPKVPTAIDKGATEQPVRQPR